MKDYYILIAGVSLIVAGFFIYSRALHKELVSHFKSQATRFSNGKKAMLTPNEIHFYGLLKKAANSLMLEVSSQVSMGALIETSGSSNDPSFWENRKRFSNKIVDFVIYDIRDSSKVVALIELDDKTHNKEKDALRDAFTNSLGFTTLRYESVSKPSVEKLIADLKALKRT